MAGDHGRDQSLARRPSAGPGYRVVPQRRGTDDVRSGFEYILAKHAEKAAAAQRSIIGKKVSPHVLRHSCAMHMLQATHDIRKVALWLGHASLQSTEAYLRADPSEKLEALGAASAPNLKAGRFRPPDKLLAMLNGR